MQATSRYLALEVALDAIRVLGPIVLRIQARDKHLADQLRRAATSIALNLAEGSGSDSGNRRARLHSALGSTRETRTALRIATAWGLVDEKTRLEVDARLDEVAAMTWCTLYRRR